MKSRFTATAAIFVVLVFAFAAGFTMVPTEAEACVAHPGCPGYGCVGPTTHSCSCGLSGDRWETKTVCRDYPWIVIEWTCSYVCAP